MPEIIAYEARWTVERTVPEYVTEEDSQQGDDQENKSNEGDNNGD